MSLKDTDVRTLGDADIAKKFKLSLAKVRSLVSQGAQHEKEHNTNLSKAKEVARDHIGERPDYYKILKKAEKTPVSMKEESTTSAVRGLGYYTGEPGVNPVTQYINTNAMSYEDENGNKLDYIKRQHTDHHNARLGYKAFDPTQIGANKNFIKEAELNELGEYDNKGGTPGYEETTGPIRAVRKRDVKESHTHEETKMDNKEYINEALDCILEDNLSEMKDNLMKALQEKAIEKLEERKKEIAANYFAE